MRHASVEASPPVVHGVGAGTVYLALFNNCVAACVPLVILLRDDPQMFADTTLSDVERDFVLAAAKEGLRVDGRKFNDYRKVCALLVKSLCVVRFDCVSVAG